MFGDNHQRDAFIEAHGDYKATGKSDHYAPKDYVSEKLGRFLALCGAQFFRGVCATLSVFDKKYDLPSSEFELVDEGDAIRLDKTSEDISDVVNE